MRTGVKKRGYMGALQGILRALELARIPVRTVRSPDERLRRYKQVDKKLKSAFEYIYPYSNGIFDISGMLSNLKILRTS
jgi:hypothetical protein